MQDPTTEAVPLPTKNPSPKDAPTKPDTKPAKAKKAAAPRKKPVDRGLFVVVEPDDKKGKRFPVKIHGPFFSRATAVSFARRKKDGPANPEAAAVFTLRPPAGWQEAARKFLGVSKAEPRTTTKVAAAVSNGKNTANSARVSDQVLLGHDHPAVAPAPVVAPTRKPSLWDRLTGRS